MNSLGGQHITSDFCTCTTLCPVRLKTSLGLLLTCGSVPPASPPQPHGRASRRLAITGTVWRASANTSAKGGSVPSHSSAISRPRFAGRPQPTFPPSGGLRTDAPSPGVAQELQAHSRPPGGGSPSARRRSGRQPRLRGRRASNSLPCGGCWARGARHLNGPPPGSVGKAGPGWRPIFCSVT